MTIKPAGENDSFTPLSQSLIWDLQRDYYRRMGVDAWQPNAVPNYVTTNPFIARSYAQVIDGFFMDFGKTGSSRKAEPHYIIELGAGSGRFAYGFLKHYFSESETAVRPKREIVYVMTDISEANIEFWRIHPQLKPFVDQGVLDFAYLDVLGDHPIHLLNSGKKIAPGTLSTPVAAIANYVIDSIPHDLFCIDSGQLKERKIRYRVNTGSGDIDDIVSNTDFEYEEVPCRRDYYENKNWNKLLASYLKMRGNLNFSLPVGGLLTIDRMSTLTAGPMFLLAGDFGATDLSVLLEMPPKKVARNGTYSLHVNFHAMAKYVELKRGTFFTPGHAKASLEMAGILVNHGRRKSKYLSYRFDAFITNNGPDEFFMLKKIAEENFVGHNLSRILALLRMSNWDIKIFRGCANALVRAMAKASSFERRTVAEALANVDDMHFRCDNTTDPAIPILKILLAIGAREVAIDILRRNHGKLAGSVEGGLALAESYRQLGLIPDAIISVKWALALESSNPDAKALLETLMQIQNQAKSA
ncbi:MAG: hypothetical protein K9G33_11610 [Sneathiella sp.]|nr:hypothetical protein [Sneathiella sp.]